MVANLGMGVMIGMLAGLNVQLEDPRSPYLAVFGR